MQQTMKKILITVVLAASTLAAQAQAEFDVLRLSQNDITGTARYMSLSGAFGALGGDVSAIGINPAGIGIYRSSEITITPAFQNSNTKAVLNGVTTKANDFKGALNGLSYVGSFKTYEGSAISNLNFGISYGKIADFNQKTNTVEEDRATSLLDRVVYLENELFPIGHTSFFKFLDETHLIKSNGNSGYLNTLALNEKTRSDMQLSESGSIHSLNFTLGADYNHFVYLGMGIGIQSVNYERTSSYLEEFDNNKGLEMRNALTTTGYGMDLKCGVIVRPIPEMRVGLAYNSGTYYAMTDAFQASLAAWNFIDPATSLPYNPDPKFIGDEESVDYVVRAPSKMTFSFAYVFNKIGLLSLDVERVENNKHNLMNHAGFEISEVNTYIQSDFRNSFNIRLGSEIRVTDNYSLRVGGAWYQSPLVKNLENLDIACPYTRPEYSMLRDTWYSSIGVGYRNGAFYIDAALQEKLSNENFFFFSDWETDPSNNPNVYANNNTYSKLTRTKVSASLTIGYKF